MNEELLQRAVKEDLNGTLGPVLQMAMDPVKPSALDMIETAMRVNGRLGYTLFPDLYPKRLEAHFAQVYQAVAKNAMKNP